jgi:hypothetical protein
MDDKNNKKIYYYITVNALKYGHSPKNGQSLKYGPPGG